MNTIVFIINGISLPYHVIDYAIEKAKENSARIFGLFLKGKHEPSKGYGYPSDLPTTETWTTEQEAVTEDEHLVTDNMNMIKRMIEDEGIAYSFVLKTNASVNEIAEIVREADLIVVDEKFDKGFLLGDNKISLKALKKKIDKPIVTVSSKEAG